MTAELAATASAAVSASATVVTAVIAGVALRSAARDSRDRTRPLLVAELRRSTLGTATQDLVIKNYGASVARNVNVLFDPPLPVTDDVARNVHWIAQRYARPVPMWAPGTMLSNVFVHPKENPGRVTVRLSYQGPGRERYADSFQLDSELMGTESFSTPSKQPGKELDRIAHALQAIAWATDRQR